MGRIITVSKEDLLWYIKWNKLGHDNSIKQNTYLSYYKWNWYWHAFRQRWPQQTIDVDISSWTGGMASFVVTPWMSYTLNDLPQWATIVNINGNYLIRYNETTIWEIIASTSSPYFFDDIVITRWQSTIQIGNTPIALENWDELDVSFITDSTDYLRFSANTADSTVALNRNGSPTSVSLEICINWGSWKTYTIWETIILNNIWDRVYFRNTSTTDTRLNTGTGNYYKFVMTWSVAWSWDISSLLNKNLSSTISEYCYYSLFSWCSSLTVAPALPITTLARFCYQNMFYWCTWLTTAPSLPATVLVHSCYRAMFQNCTWLITPPTISATALSTYCCQSMFEWCAWLTTAPTLNITTLEQNCYTAMFRWCTWLTTTPRLPATTLESWCYANMFENCSNLTTVSAISATTLSSNCCQAMFRNCTSLTTAPTLSATTMVMWCYQEMFKWCTSLVTAPALPATTLDYNCYQGMFQDCTSLTTPSRLPATTVASWCYAYMYRWCTSLNKLPALPATTFGSYSYYQMFNWCSNIRMSETQDWTYTNAYRIPTTWTWWETWYSLNDMFGNTWWTFTSTPTINTTYYTSNTIVS
jgi:hypothetical protein